MVLVYWKFPFFYSSLLGLVGSRYIHTGAVHADLGDHQECVRVWNYALGLQIMKETLLSLDAEISLRSLVNFYRDTSHAPRFSDVITTLRLLNSGLEVAMDLLAVRPRDRAQENNFDRILQAWLKLCYLLIEIQQSFEV